MPEEQPARRNRDASMVDPLVTPVLKGVDAVGISALVLVPLACFHELLPEPIRLATTPNSILLPCFLLVAVCYGSISGVVTRLGRKRESG